MATQAELSKTAAGGRSVGGKRPNIIMIITDQQRYDTIGALGYPYMETPNLDRLVAEGVTFTNCHVASPACTPSRASLFTGLYPHSTGIVANDYEWRHTWAEQLTASGYYCVNVGKMHTGPYDAPAGFHERYVVENKDRYIGITSYEYMGARYEIDERYFLDEWDKALASHGLVKQNRDFYRALPDYKERMGAFEWNLPEHLHSDMFVGDLACWWLDHKPRPEQPLFLEIGFPGPHPPFDPIPRYAERYMHKDLPIPKVKPEDLAGQPPAFGALREHNHQVDHDSIYFPLEPTREQIHRTRAYYYANVTMIDEKIGQLMDTLGRHGYLEDSIVIFTSDHGDALCEHGQIEKWTMYDNVVRVPLIVHSPSRFESGVKVEGLCQSMDVVPVIFDAAGIDLPEHMETESIAPALRGEPWQGRETVFTEIAGDSTLAGTEFMTMVRRRRWKLVHFLGAEFGQLFDLEIDPGEERNLWDSPEHASIRRELLDELLEWRIASSFRTRHWAGRFR